MPVNFSMPLEIFCDLRTMPFFISGGKPDFVAQSPEDRDESQYVAFFVQNLKQILPYLKNKTVTRIVK